MTISATFSVVIYGMLSRELDRFEQLHRIRIQRRMVPPNVIAPDPELIEEIRHRVIMILVFINGGIFVAAGGFGYMLAGRTLKPIQNMVEDQNRFISDASHELRTPLTSLKTAMEVYLREKKPTLTDAKILVNESIEEVDKLHSLADSLLQLAHYQDPNEKLLMKQVELNSIIKKSIQRMKSIAQKKQITIEATGIADITVLGDYDNLVKVFVILIDNAIKYSPANTTVTITSSHTDKCAMVTVADHGEGIDPKHAPHIFKRFYRANKARNKTTADGYGLGLSIAKKIIDLHNGTIRFTSATDQGTTFTVKIPR